MMLIIENNGQDIIRTNFWQTEQARQGAFYLSINAGAFRLLIPYKHNQIIAEFEAAKEVVISRGPWTAAEQRDAIEILFDDGTDDPYSIHLGAAQVDRWPSPEDAGRVLQFSVWTLKDGKPYCAYRAECYYHSAPHLPWLQPRGADD